MPAQAAALAAIAARTLAHYDTHAREFWEGMRDHDVRQNIHALLSHIQGAVPFELLDLGCGPGRDLATFRALGHHATGLEGAPRAAAMARAHSGCTVWEQSFLALQLPAAHFDGVFANASLFHVPGQALPRVLGELRECLKPGGVLFTSNPRGQGQEGWQGERYGVFHDWPQWQALLGAAGFTLLDHFYRPEHLPLAQRPWLASVWRRPLPENGAPRALQAPELG